MYQQYNKHPGKEMHILHKTACIILKNVVHGFPKFGT